MGAPELGAPVPEAQPTLAAKLQLLVLPVEMVLIELLESDLELWVMLLVRLVNGRWDRTCVDVGVQVWWRR